LNCEGVFRVPAVVLGLPAVGFLPNPFIEEVLFRVVLRGIVFWRCLKCVQNLVGTIQVPLEYSGEIKWDLGMNMEF